MSEPNFPTVHIRTALEHEPELPHPSSVKVGTFRCIPLVVTQELETDYRWPKPQTTERHITKEELRFKCIEAPNGEHVWRIVNGVYL